MFSHRSTHFTGCSIRVNLALKAAVAAAVHDDGRHRLVAQVAQSNVVSIAAVAKAFSGARYEMSAGGGRGSATDLLVA